MMTHASKKYLIRDKTRKVKKGKYKSLINRLCMQLFCYLFLIRLKKRTSVFLYVHLQRKFQIRHKTYHFSDKVHFRVMQKPPKNLSVN